MFLDPCFVVAVWRIIYGHDKCAFCNHVFLCSSQLGGLSSTSARSDPPHPYMTHPTPPHPYMTHSTPSWPSPPHPYMTHPPLHDPPPPLHDPPHPTSSWSTPPHPYMTHPTPPHPLYDPPYTTPPTPGTFLGTKEPFFMGCFTMSPFR